MKIKVRKGNLKVGKNTYIINITSATDCPGIKQCQLQNISACYALKAERQYPNILPYRRAQTEIWDTLSCLQIARQLIKKTVRKGKVKMRYLRFSEAGDFRNQMDVDRMSRLADLLKGYLIVYGYTARKDLDFSNISSNIVITGSGFMVHNQFKVVNEKKDLNNSGPICGGNCRKCTLCKVNGNYTIQALLH